MQEPIAELNIQDSQRTQDSRKERLRRGKETKSRVLAHDKKKEGLQTVPLEYYFIQNK